MAIEKIVVLRLPSNLSEIAANGYRPEGPALPEVADLDWRRMNEEQRQAALARMRHSAAHVMADAVLSLFPDAKLGIGPAIEEGFYYDLDLPRALTLEDLAEIEQRMAQIVAGKHRFERIEIDRDEARRWFAERGQQYKVELIDDLPEDEQITFYRDGKFVDLCRGPHVEHTGQIGAFKLLNVAGAYWRGDEKRPMLQRIYGTAFPSQEELDRHLYLLEEAKRRDHRRIGKELELFHLDPTAPGMPYWLPKGLKVLNELLAFWRAEHEKRGYQEIASPLINNKSIWETSGHWEHYRDDMFVIPIDEHTTYAVKPMNCPNAMIVYNLKTRSYRDLPFRLSDCDMLHRNERSGTLHGLLRVQKIQQDDAHIFVTEDQIEEEFDQILEIAHLFYSIFGLKYSYRLGTRPESYIGDIETWNKAEADLVRILDKHVGREGYRIQDGDGAFYGPKIDILMEDALGRSWQMGTLQLDFQQPRRFNCKYIDRDGQEKTPVVIHRVIYGSMERFIGILIEHTAGAFPIWLAPVQVVVIPVANRHLDYARKVTQQLKAAGLRAELNGDEQRMNYKIREAQLQKIPYILVVGNHEEANDSVAVRLRSNENLGAKPVAEFIALAKDAIARRE